MGVGGRGADSSYLALHISLSLTLPLSLWVISSLSLSLFLCFSVLFSLARSRISFLLLSLSFLFVCRSFFTLFLCRIRCLYRCIVFLSLSVALPSLSLSTVTLLHHSGSLYLSFSLYIIIVNLSLSHFIFFVLHPLSVVLASISSLSKSLSFCLLALLSSPRRSVCDLND